jgi:hypothetical protein
MRTGSGLHLITLQPGGHDPPGLAFEAALSARVLERRRLSICRGGVALNYLRPARRCVSDTEEGGRYTRMLLARYPYALRLFSVYYCL